MGRRSGAETALLHCRFRETPGGMNGPDENGSEIWLGREDSNLRMAESKSAALPLGDAPIRLHDAAKSRVGATLAAAAECRNQSGPSPVLSSDIPVDAARRDRRRCRAFHRISSRESFASMSANTDIKTVAAPPLPKPRDPHLFRMANCLRALAMDAVEKAKSGHPGMPMGMADVATVLFTKYLKFDPAQPLWPDRDRFVLSTGHGSMLLYALLYLTGYPDITIEEIKRFRQLGSRTAGHPEHGHALGIETTTGPLGQGVGNAVGMALAERHLAARFGSDLVDHRTFVLCSDGDLEEGISHEACSLAGHYRLNRLIFLYDDNGISIDGPTSLSFSDDVLRRFEGYHWNTARVDGQDPAAVDRAIAAALDSDRPTIIACKTTIGYGAPTKAGTEKAHG